MKSEYKITIIRELSCGGHSLVIRYVQNLFFEYVVPAIDDYYRKIVTINGKTVTIEFLVTTAKDQFTAMRDLYFKNGEGFVYVYSITDKTSFNALDSTVDHICQVKNKDVGDIPIVFAGTKCDREDARQVTKEEGRLIAQNFSAHVHCTCKCK